MKRDVKSSPSIFWCLAPRLGHAVAFVVTWLVGALSPGNHIGLGYMRANKDNSKH